MCGACSQCVCSAHAGRIDRAHAGRHRQRRHHCQGTLGCALGRRGARCAHEVTRRVCSTAPGRTCICPTARRRLTSPRTSVCGPSSRAHTCYSRAARSRPSGALLPCGAEDCAHVCLCVTRLCAHRFFSQDSLVAPPPPPQQQPHAAPLPARPKLALSKSEVSLLRESPDARRAAARALPDEGASPAAWVARYHQLRGSGASSPATRREDASISVSAQVSPTALAGRSAVGAAATAQQRRRLGGKKSAERRGGSRRATESVTTVGAQPAKDVFKALWFES
jgi:hypothetical protein